MQHREVAENTYILRFEIDEPLRDTFGAFLEKEHINAGFFYGLGAFSHVRLAYYTLNGKRYYEKDFTEELEVLNITGNVAQVEGRPFIHMHVALGRTDYSVIGGHIMDAIVSPTLEVVLETFKNPIERKMDDTIGLKLLSLDHCGFGKR